MMTPRFVVPVLLAGLLALPPVAQAQFVGPSSRQQPHNVADILKKPIDDQQVVLRGRITQQVGKKKYIFADDSGEIRVEIEAKTFPARPIDEKTMVELRGEVEKDFLQSPEIDVDSLVILDAAAR
jgi:uncharacterized protein (TIGR00156 family)